MKGFSLKSKNIYDVEYWEGRNFSEHYYWMAQQFIDFFEPTKMIDVGCGKGYFVHAFEFYDVSSIGYDVSVEAISHPYELAKGKLYHSDQLDRDKKQADLVICFDVFEHIPIEEMDSFTEKVLMKGTKNFLFSICVFGDPNFERDSTHKTKRTKAWWVNYFNDKGLISIETPLDFLEHNQILLFRRE